MEVDQRFLTWLQEDEGKKLFVYPDSNNVPTIGIGHKLRKSERYSGKIIIDGISVRYKNGLTNDQIYALCRQDTKIASDCVNNLVKVPLNQNQFNVLVGFTFNIGTEAFSDSTLLKRLNLGYYSEVPKQLMRWVYDDGVFIEGLELRRKRDVNRWLS